MAYTTISFYQYFLVEYPEKLQHYLRILCKDLSLKGRILIAKEGVNAAVSGTAEDVARLKQILHENPLFVNLTFREQPASFVSHHKLVVRVRTEIVRFGVPVDLQNTGSPLSPAELQKWYINKEEFIIVDARNDYEYKIGKFKDAITLPIHHFREFPEVAVQSLKPFQQKKIVLYCTGGIRCEKASAYLREQGFEQVYQIEGGIINYINNINHNSDPHLFPESSNSLDSTGQSSFKNYWEGGLFVFDDRIVSDVAEPITECTFCQTPCEQYYNCHNLDCDKLFIACSGCSEIKKFTCSDLCQRASRQRKKAG